jgi:hypothetical protein
MTADNLAGMIMADSTSEIDSLIRYWQNVDPYIVTTVAGGGECCAVLCCAVLGQPLVCPP